MTPIHTNILVIKHVMVLLSLNRATTIFPFAEKKIQNDEITTLIHQD